ncbi:tyrosine phosphatase [Danaus plexippus plexippus]|uniref:Tyrosine phosphatase n=1 Tax=Danaus plexippus plexippus TaxID=278856 RepID=A0A212EH56_DANPL|nr:tyrosine phosphatase [Danaus plexippus plexippus]
MSPDIPDRWLAYKACGKVIDGTRIICFKVPLSKTIKRKKGKEPWNINTLLRSIPKLGAVIDLTNTNKYYSPMELQRKGILYKKIFMPGRFIPPQNKVTEFMDTVDGFLQGDDDSLVGVHCTHGLNRTGYMVCRYMRDRLGISPHDAIKEFQRARGYAIERQNYVADILGEIPPPPDVGPDCSTIVRPIDDTIDESPVKHNKTKKSKKNFNCNITTDKNYKNKKSNPSDYGRSSNKYNFKYDY